MLSVLGIFLRNIQISFIANLSAIGRVFFELGIILSVKVNCKAGLLAILFWINVGLFFGGSCELYKYL